MPNQGHMRAEECPDIRHDVVVRAAALDLVTGQARDWGQGAHHAWHSHHLIQQRAAIEVHHRHAAGRSIVVPSPGGGTLNIERKKAHGGAEEMMEGGPREGSSRMQLFISWRTQSGSKRWFSGGAST